NFYPKGGVGRLVEKMEKGILESNGLIFYDCQIERILISDHQVAGVRYKDKHGKSYNIENVKIVSSLPLNELIGLLSSVSLEVESKAKLLDYCPMRFFYLIVNRNEVLDAPWVYFSDADAIFNRLSDMSKFSKTLVTEGKTILCFEISCRINDAQWSCSDNEIFDKIIPVLKRYNILSQEDIEGYFSEFVAHSYPLFFEGFEKIISSCLQELEQIQGLVTIGRQGLYTYANIDDAMKMGILAADLIRQENQKIDYKKTFGKYLFY
ncbi:MAG: hypothetical protein ACYDFR_05050, partial [Candidatus Omnitrophota bacterium]